MRALIGLVCVAGAVGSANAQLIVGVDDPATPVYGLNVNGGSWTALFTPGTSDVWGMAADDASGILYYNSGTSLYKVPYNTLVPELVGLINVGGTNKSMVSLAFANGVLYATSNIGGDGGARKSVV